MAWKVENVTVIILKKHFQSIHTKTEHVDGEELLFTYVYISPIE